MVTLSKGALCQPVLGVAQREAGQGAGQTGQWGEEVSGFLGLRDESTGLLGDQGPWRVTLY